MLPTSGQKPEGGSPKSDVGHLHGPHPDPNPASGVFTPDDLADWNPAAALGFPGEFPFTRGIQPTMYRGRLWTMRQYAGFGSAEASNRRYRYLLDHGVGGLSVA